LALSRKRKEELVESYAERLGRCQMAIWADYRGLNMGRFEDLRRRLRQVGAETMVVKNTLLRIALDQSSLPTAGQLMEGPNAIVFVYDDLASAARVVTAFARENEQAFKIKGGVLGGQVVDAGQVADLENLPTREVLLAQVVGGMSAPISGLVGTLSAVMRGLLNVLNAHREQLEGAAG